MSYSFSTNKGSSVDVNIPLTGDATGNDLSIEFSRNVNSRNIFMTKAVTLNDGFAELKLSPEEVLELKDVHYRVKGIINNELRYFQTGSIDYLTPRGARTQGLTIEEVIDAPELRANYVLRDEYIAGEGADPAVIQGYINTKLADHVESPTPHPKYDDLPSLRLLFENGLI